MPTGTPRDGYGIAAARCVGDSNVDGFNCGLTCHDLPSHTCNEHTRLPRRTRLHTNIFTVFYNLYTQSHKKREKYDLLISGARASRSSASNQPDYQRAGARGESYLLERCTPCTCCSSTHSKLRPKRLSSHCVYSPRFEPDSVLTELVADGPSSTHSATPTV